MTQSVNARVDLMIDGAWTNITSDVRVEEGITISRGRKDEASSVDPQSCMLTLSNPTGKYSPRNPEGPYFGLIGRNSPLRVGVGTPVVATSQAFNTGAGTNLVAPSVTAEAAGGTLTSYWITAPGANITVPVSMTTQGETDISTVLTRASARENVGAGATGTRTATTSVSSTAYAASSFWVPGHTGAATSNGSNSSAASGTDVSVTPTTSAGDLIVVAMTYFGTRKNVSLLPAPKDYYYNDGQGWTLLSDSGPQFSSSSSIGIRTSLWCRRANGSSTQIYLEGLGLSGDTGNAIDLKYWVYSGRGDDYITRFVGEVSEFPARWDLSEADVTVPLEAYGILRRLNQSSRDVLSALKSWILSDKGLVAYWPLEDAEGATNFLAATAGTANMVFKTTVDPVPAATETLVSKPIPTFTSASAKGVVQSHTTPVTWAVGALMSIPSAGMTDETLLMTITTTGTAKTWKVFYDTGTNQMRYTSYDSEGVQISTALRATGALNGTTFYMYLSNRTVGADVGAAAGWASVSLTPTAAQGVSVGTLAGSTIGRVTSVTVGDKGLTGDPSIGHVAVLTSSKNDYGLFFYDGDLDPVFQAYDGELAGDRLERLTLQESVRAKLTYGSISEPMGPVKAETLLAIVNQCAATDNGLLYEPIGFIGLAYRERNSWETYNDIGFTMTYSSGHVSEPFEPTDDDQFLVNESTVTRIDGGSGKSQVTVGPLSNQEVPDGVGPYVKDESLSLYLDNQTVNQAGWNTHLGTWDATRFPAVRLDLVKNPSFKTTAAVLDVGYVFSLDSLPDWVFQATEDNKKYIIQGYTEKLTSNRWDIVYTTGPWGPYRTVTLDSSTHGRLDGSDWYTDSSMDTTDTSVTLLYYGASTIPPSWTTTGVPFSINIGDEQMTVTAVTAYAGGFQTFTVTRSVNGVVKEHGTVAPVHLSQPTYVAL